MKNLPWRWRDTGLYLLILLSWIVSSQFQLGKYLHGFKLAAAAAAGAAFLLALMMGLRRLIAKGNGNCAPGWFAAFWIFMAALYLVLYPISQRHITGVGSDAEDALRAAGTQMVHEHYPYSVKTYLGNAISPLPGAVLMAVPFLLLGRVSAQNVLWLAVFIYFCLCVFRYRATALAFLIVTSLASLVPLDNFVVGGDYGVNLWYVSIGLYFFLQSHTEDAAGWVRLASGVFLGMALSSRLIYPLVLLPLMAAYLYQRRGLRAALLSLSVVVLVFAAVTAPFYLHDPAHFAPLHVEHKLDFLAPQYRQIGLKGLTLAALAAACSGFFVRLTLDRLFLIAGIASGITLLIPGMLFLLLSHFQLAGWAVLSYGALSMTWMVLWALRRFEEDGSEHLPSGLHAERRPATT